MFRFFRKSGPAHTRPAPPGRPSASSRRREELRRIVPRPTLVPWAILQKPAFMHAAVILIAFLLLTSGLVAWSRDQIKVRDGQIMTVTRIKRLSYQVEDEEQTGLKRDDARKNSPRLYRINDAHLSRLEESLTNVPKAVAGKTDISEISPDVRAEFNLNEHSLRNLQNVVIAPPAAPQTGNGPLTNEPSQAWIGWVQRLVREELVRLPLIRSTEYQNYVITLNKALLAPVAGSQGEADLLPVPREAIELRSDPNVAPDARLGDVVTRAGFPPQLAGIVLARLTYDPQPTLLYVEEETAALAKRRAEAVPPVTIEHKRGDILYRRGEVLSPEQYGEVQREAEHFAKGAPVVERWKVRFGTIGLIALVTMFLGSFAATAYPKILRNPLRIGAICVLMASMLALTVYITAYAPIFLYPAAIGPTLFVAIILLVAYDQRLSLLLSGLQCMAVTLALEQSIGFFILLVAGCATAILQLREVRHRHSLIRAATGTATVLGAGTIMLGLLELPMVIDAPARMVPGASKQIFIMALSSVLTSYGVSFLVLGILPSIERIFDITTGMTLAELRDPKRPLLRQLQQRAPGTYNHSLQVANIAEAAAEAIGANSLLVYVGALYHDIGKINKPDYFVENQTGGASKHDKLSPAMSLLVIIGHVKNGIELAREYGLPRSIIHFIESHHGTTLVEYFYHAARSKAESSDPAASSALPSEVEYRYPGPKPQTKEAAILMLSDAVESATRAMTEPNPSRIENLVRKLSAKRLEDGQFDQCDLTFRELALIEDAIIARVLAIYHGRISYPSTAMGAAGARETPEPPQVRPASA